MNHIAMVFKPSAKQQADLDGLLKQQQDPSSPNYHRWLSADEFADRFGLNTTDLDRVAAWLRAQGFTIATVGRSRSSITFNGSADQVETAFHTSIHAYVVDNETYYANATEPAVPAAFAGMVLGFRALNNFRLQPRVRAQYTSSTSGSHFLSPSDFATIYDVAAAYAGGLDGSGQTIAIMGQTNIQVSDIEAFRNAAGLPPNDPDVILVPGSTDPGSNTGDLMEADLDLEWSGAIAPAAHIIYVNSTNVLWSFQYAIEQNLAPVISISYGTCENNYSEQDREILSALGTEANALGITILSASGDTGAAACDAATAPAATLGLAVDLPASLPFVTALGGSDFHEATAAWSASNNAANGSALSYIPEVAWNDTSSYGLSASGGGRSAYFPKPGWQAGNGVPDDSARDVPDISFHASPNHDGYLLCTQGSCAKGFRSSAGMLTVAGGTSATAPAFAGVVALIDQSVGLAQGNINPILYGLAALAPSTFHDVISGGNQVPCQAGTPDCSSTGSIGYSAGPGYDLATGLGSVDIASLIAGWPGSTMMSTTQAPTGASSATTTTAASNSQSSVSAAALQPIPAVEQGNTRSGYIVITPDSNSATPTPTMTFGIVNGGIVQSEAGLMPTAMLTDGTFFANVVPGIGRNLGISFLNTGDSTNLVILTLRDTSGNTMGSPVMISLAPQQQVSRFLNEFFSPTTIGSGCLGSVRFQSSAPLNALGLRFSAAEFSTLPVAVNASVNPVAGAAIVLPQFALGGGWATQLALLNNSTAAIAGRIDIFDSDGNPMSVPLNGLTQSTFRYSLAPNGTFLLAPRDVNGQSPF